MCLINQSLHYLRGLLKGLWLLLMAVEPTIAEAVEAGWKMKNKN